MAKQSNTSLALRKTYKIEREYHAKQKRHAKLSKVAHLQQEELEKLSSELDVLGEKLESSEEVLWAQLKRDGSWKATLIGDCWRWWMAHRY